MDPNSIESLEEQISKLPATSIRYSKETFDTHTNVVRDPSSQWGGREVQDGGSNSQEIYVTLEGDIPGDTRILDNKSLQEILNKEITEHRHAFNGAIFDIIEDDFSGYRVDGMSVKVVALSVMPDGQYFVKINATIEVVKDKSEEDLYDEWDAQQPDSREE